MANTIESTTDEALLRSLIDGSIEGTFEDDTITTLTREGLFYECNALTDVILSNVTSMSGYSFVPSNSSASSCTSLKTINTPKLINLTGELYRLPTLKDFNAPNLTNLANTSSYALRYCNSIEKIHLPKLTLCNFYGNNALKYVVLPNVINVRAVRATHGSFIALDLGETCTNLNLGGDNIFYQTENDNTEALILRSKTLLPLTRSSLNGSVSANRVFGYFDKNKIYVPQDLVEDYKVATNWSTFADCFESIEGSKYEYYYADGTPIGLGNGTGLIAYYDVGNINDWDSETKLISNHINSDFVAWNEWNHTIGSNNSSNHIPSTYYNKYATQNGALEIYFNKALKDFSDIITIEFLTTSNNDTFAINVNGSIKNNSTQGKGQDWGTGGIVRSVAGMDSRHFSHVVIVFNNTGAIKIYINGDIKNWNRSIDNCLDATCIGIGGTNHYLGCIALYNRELSQEEITQHYNYYVDTAMVGQKAYDNNNNFVGGWISGKSYLVDWGESGYEINSSGEIVSGTGYASNLLNCREVSAIKVSPVTNSGTLSYYDAQGTFLRKIGFKNANLTAVENPWPSPVPLDAYYVRLDTRNTSTTITPYKYEKITNDTMICELNKKYVLTFNTTSEPITVYSNYVYCYDKNKLQTSLYARSFIYFYDENKTQISSTIRQEGMDEIDIPDTAYYLRLHPNSSSMNPNPWIEFTA